MIEIITSYLCVGIMVSLSGLGTALGQARSSGEAFKAINRQPAVQKNLFSLFMLGIAILETASVLGFFVAAVLLTSLPLYGYSSIALYGISCAVALPALCAGLYGALPVKSGLAALARQPFLSSKITQLMTLCLMLLQTPLIFGFIIALIIQFNLNPSLTYAQSLVYCAAGFCIGCGAVGTIIGIGKFSQRSLGALSKNTQIASRITTLSMVSISLIEASVIFALIIAFTLCRLAATRGNLTVTQAVILVIAGLLSGLGSIAPALGSAHAASEAARSLPLVESVTARELIRTSMLGQVFIDSTTIYTFITALLLTYLL